MSQKHSRLGISSTIIWGTVAAFCVWLYFSVAKGDLLSSIAPENFMGGLVALISLGVGAFFIGSIISLILGIMGIRQKDRNTLFAKIGTTLSGISLIAPILFVLFGMVSK